MAVLVICSTGILHLIEHMSSLNIPYPSPDFSSMLIKPLCLHNCGYKHIYMTPKSKVGESGVASMIAGLEMFSSHFKRDIWESLPSNDRRVGDVSRVVGREEDV